MRLRIHFLFTSFRANQIWWEQKRVCRCTHTVCGTHANLALQKASRRKAERERERILFTGVFCQTHSVSYIVCNSNLQVTLLKRAYRRAASLGVSLTLKLKDKGACSMNSVHLVGYSSYATYCFSTTLKSIDPTSCNWQTEQSRLSI